MASFNTELQRDGPGLLLRDIQRGEDQVAAVAKVIARTAPEILLLQGIDWDYENRALHALADTLEDAGVSYPHRFALRPNTGIETGLDLDGDGRLAEPEDAQGFGPFTGYGGIALLSVYPVISEDVQEFSSLLWRDLPGAKLPVHPDGAPFPSAEAQKVQRLSTTGHWAVPVALPDGDRLTVLTWQAGPPVFDGPEDRNGLRNHDENAFWLRFLDGEVGRAPSRRFVLAGGANADPNDGDGRREAIRALLTDPRLRDPEPASPGAAQADPQGHRGPDALDTVDWRGPGRLRVDYILPSADWTIVGAGVHWPAQGSPGHEDALTASRHRLVWVDLLLD